MIQAVFSNTTINDMEQKVLHEQVRLLYDGMKLSLIATVVIAGLFSYLMWGNAESNHNVALWFIIMIVIVLLRTGDTVLYLRKSREGENDDKWRKHFFVGSTSAGICWGISIWLIQPTDITYLAILILVVMGIVSGATATLSYRWESMIYFMSSAIGLLVIKLFLIGKDYSLLLAILLIIFFLFALSSTQRIYRNTQQNVRLRIQATAREEAIAAAQQRQQLHIAQTPVAIIECDLGFNITEWNPSAERIFGYRRDEMLGMDIRSYIIQESYIQDMETYWQRLLELKMPLEAIFVDNITRDGSIITCEWFVTPLVDHNDEVIGVTAQVFDVTSQKQAERELILAKESAEKANNAKSEFMASMSHELRTPLNAILGFSQLLEFDQELGSQQKNNAAEIYKAGSHLLELINDVLDLSRIESGRLELSLETVSLEKLFEDCFSLIIPLAEQQGIQVHVNAEECNRLVHADYTRLKQVILNLLSNALKYNRINGSIWITCSKENNGYIKISIKDTGKGIAPDLLPGLFESFNRLGAEASEIEGTGIGLVISKQLIEAMGGSIHVDSILGEGSTFWIEVPLSKDITAVADTTPPVSEPQVEQIQGTQHTILYVEDNLANLRLVQQIVAMRSDTKLLHAPSAELGLEIARTHQPELVLLDINLPGMDGFEAFARLRDDPQIRDIPVIAISADAMKEDIERALELGFTEYITKPIDVSQIMEILDSLLL